MKKKMSTWQKIKKITYNLFVWLNVFFIAFIAFCSIFTAVEMVFIDPFKYWGAEAFCGAWHYESGLNYFLNSLFSVCFVLPTIWFACKWKKLHPVRTIFLLIFYYLFLFRDLFLYWDCF